MNLISKIKNINVYTDNAKAALYQNQGFITGKSVKINLIESFNFKLRNYISCLRRKSLAFAKTKFGLEYKIMLNILNFHTQ